MGLRRLIAAFLLASLVAGCGGSHTDGPPPQADALGDCLKREIYNFTRLDHLLGLRVERWIPAGVRADARDVRVYGPLDTTFGEEIDGAIVPPAETGFVFLDDEILVRFRTEPTDRQQEAVDGCLNDG